MKYFAGIGSRETPQHILNIMTEVSRALTADGYILRSGGAQGADEAFYKGASKHDIYIPWRGYNGFTETVVDGPAYQKVASQVHPAWHRCSEGAKKLHARNVAIILGEDGQTPVDFVVCWTKDGGATGGTGLAIRICNQLDIPVFNLFYEDALDKLSDLVNQ